MMDLTQHQKELLAGLGSELRRQVAISYIKNGYQNKKQSYLDACKIMGKKPSNSPETSGTEILSYPDVIGFLNSVKEVSSKEAQVDAIYVLRRLKEIDELDIIDIMLDDLSAFKPLSEWPKSWRTSISGLDLHSIMSGGDEPIETLVKKIKWPDKTKNLELIGKHVNVKAWEKEQLTANVTNNIMPVPTADSVEDWEAMAAKNQDELFGG